MRGDSGDAVSARSSREVLLTLKRLEIDLFVSAPLFLVEAGHPMSRGVNFEGPEELEALEDGSAGGARPNEEETNVVVVVAAGSVVTPLQPSLGYGCSSGRSTNTEARGSGTPPAATAATPGDSVFFEKYGSSRPNVQRSARSSFLTLSKFPYRGAGFSSQFSRYL